MCFWLNKGYNILFDRPIPAGQAIKLLTNLSDYDTNPEELLFVANIPTTLNQQPIAHSSRTTT
jgi:hypothetical protein